MSSLREMTVSDLGPEATVSDLQEFRDLVAQLMVRQPELTEDEAITRLWGRGDYLRNARELGLRLSAMTRFS